MEPIILHSPFNPRVEVNNSGRPLSPQRAKLLLHYSRKIFALSPFARKPHISRNREQEGRTECYTAIRFKQSTE